MKNKIFTSILFGVLIFALSGCMDTTSSKSYSSEDIGIRKTDLLDENSVTLKGFVYNTTPAGESKNIDRAFENAPPLIPHEVEGMMEITKDLNMCTTCHLPIVAVELNSTSMPKSHFISILTNKDLGDQMDEARYSCNQCHVPQVLNLEPLVKNNFDPSFRNKDSAHQSNLIDILNEGVN